MSFCLTSPTILLTKNTNINKVHRKDAVTNMHIKPNLGIDLK